MSLFFVDLISTQRHGRLVRQHQHTHLQFTHALKEASGKTDAPHPEPLRHLVHHLHSCTAHPHRCTLCSIANTCSGTWAHSELLMYSIAHVCRQTNHMRIAAALLESYERQVQSVEGALKVMASKITCREHHCEQADL